MKREMEDLRQQLQLLKKQTMTALDQARKSSDRDKLLFFKHKNPLSWYCQGHSFS
jgi:hypothetical protein